MKPRVFKKNGLWVVKYRPNRNRLAVSWGGAQCEYLLRFTTKEGCRAHETKRRRYRLRWIYTKRLKFNSARRRV